MQNGARVHDGCKYDHLFIAVFAFEGVEFNMAGGFFLRNRVKKLSFFPSPPCLSSSVSNVISPFFFGLINYYFIKPPTLYFIGKLLYTDMAHCTVTLLLLTTETHLNS